MKKDGKYGYIDATGNLIVACERGMLPGVFSEGRASVITLEGKRVMIDTHGNIVIK